MNRETRYDARIAFRLPRELYDRLDRWADEEDRPLANLIYTIVKQAVADHDKTTAAQPPKWWLQ